MSNQFYLLLWWKTLLWWRTAGYLVEWDFVKLLCATKVFSLPLSQYIFSWGAVDNTVDPVCPLILLLPFPHTHTRTPLVITIRTRAWLWWIRIIFARGSPGLIMMAAAARTETAECTRYTSPLQNVSALYAAWGRLASVVVYTSWRTVFLFKIWLQLNRDLYQLYCRNARKWSMK